MSLINDNMEPMLKFMPKIARIEEVEEEEFILSDKEMKN